MATKVITGLVRFSYANVWTPTSMEEGQEKKYNTAILIPKSDEKTLKAIQNAIDVETELFKAKNSGKLPKNFKTPLKDGDTDYDGTSDAYEGMMYLRASSKRQPAIVDETREAILDQGEFYSGCWGRASLNLYNFDVTANKGVAVGLNSVQKLKDDDNLGGAASNPKEDFAEDLEDDDLL